MKIQDQFVHPLYYVNRYDDYIGLLITTDMPQRDTFFLSNCEERHHVFHRKLAFIPTTITLFAEYNFNRWIIGPVGDVVVDTRTRQMTMNLKALNPSDNKEVTVKFRGTKLQ